MREILSAEQPCILCGQSLMIVTWYRDDDTGQERTERETVAHDDVACSSFARLAAEFWPIKARSNLRLGVQPSDGVPVQRHDEV